MKIKTFNKKLLLNKRTVSNLSHAEMNEIKGKWCPTDTCITGVEPTICPTEQPDCDLPESIMSC
jgi:hypothetical protein